MARRLPQRSTPANLDARVLQLLGQEFGAFRWGYTVDPPLPGLTKKPLGTRDLLPLGSPGAMDLLFALDDRFQTSTIEPAAIAPVARLLGADTIWLTNDAAFERFRTARPEPVAELFAAGVPGVGPVTSYGDAVANIPVLPMVDEAALTQASVGEPLPPVQLVTVQDAPGIVRVADRTVVLVGQRRRRDRRRSGRVCSPATRPCCTRPTCAPTTTCPRPRWRWSSPTPTATGPTSGAARRTSPGSPRPVAPTVGSCARTTPTSACRCSPTRRLPTRRPPTSTPVWWCAPPATANRSPTDPSSVRPWPSTATPRTAWVVGDRANPIGERLEVSDIDGQLTLLQPQDTVADRMITGVRVAPLDGSSPAVDVTLDESSLTAPGQHVDGLAHGPVSITITAVAPRPGGTDSGPSAVGFAELGLGPNREVVDVPTGVLDRVDPATPVSIVLTRERTDPLDRWRSDPEPAIVRRLSLPRGAVRLARR